MKLFLLNIGNTNTQFAEWEDGRIVALSSLPTSNLSELQISDKEIPIAASSVVPATKKYFEGKNVFWVSPEKKCGIDMTEIDCSTFGSDRFANLAALANFANLPAIVLDFGTAITIDFLDENKRFKGGAILPGRLTSRKGLNNLTAQIPLVPFSDQIPVFGRNTFEAVRSGIDIGTIGAVKEIISRMCQEINKKAHIAKIAIGGDVEFFIKNIPELIYGGNDFTLKGIAKIWELNQ